MASAGAPFDLALAYPQWQGSGRHANLPRGAEAAAAVSSRFAPVARVPLSDDAVDAEGVQRWGAILEQFRSAQEILKTANPERILTAGGDCAVDVAVIDYLRGLHSDLTIIWVDAHLDANTPETSPSGSFHGMPVSAIFGRAPEAMQRFLGPPIDPRRFHYFGIRVGDEGDWAFQRELGLGTLGPETAVAGPVHIHFDLDVLEPTEFPYLAYREPNGLRVDDAVALLGRIAREADIVGLTVTEFAPASEDEAQEGSKVIAQLCEAVAHQ